MKIVLIICGIIYLITVIYNLIATTAVAHAVKRKLVKLHPELIEKKIKQSASERIIATIPAFIPIIHNFMALTFLFKQEDLIERTYDKMIVDLTNY